MVKVQQALWGYSDGHHLLESSILLSNQAKRILSPLTDLSGSEFPLSFDGYLTGCPLKGEKCYALSKTWYATEMNRPGCVWTHTLFIHYDTVGHITAAEIDKLFRRPIAGESDLAEYSVPIILDNYDNSVPEMTPNVDKITLDLFSIIIQNISMPIIISASSAEPFNRALESLIEALGITFFDNTSFCTGSFSNRMVYRMPLDLQIVPTTVSKLVRRSSRNKIVYADLPSDNKTIISAECFAKTKEFILYCDKKFLKRTYWLTFSTILSKISSPMPFSTVEIISSLKDGMAVEDAVKVFRKIMHAIYLPTEYSIDKDLDSKISVLLDLFSSNYEFLETSSIIDEATVCSILDILYNESHGNVIHLISKFPNCTINQLGNNAIKHISEIFTVNDFSSLLEQNVNMALWLIPFNLNLLLCKDLWKQDKSIQLIALKKLTVFFQTGNSKIFDWESIISLIFRTSIYDITGGLYETFGDFSVNAFFDWYEKENTCISETERWVNLCRYNQILSIEKLKNTNSPELFAMVINALDPYDRKIKEIPVEIWELFYKRFCKTDNPSDVNNIYAQFILPIIIESSCQFSNQLTKFAFITVHNSLARGGMNYQRWSKLSCLLPDSSRNNAWDRCKRLRKAAKFKNLDIDFKIVDE